MSMSGTDGIEPCRKPHVQTRINGLERQITHLEEAMSTLSSRLNLVCRDDPNSEVKSETAKEPTETCELAKILHDFEERVVRVIEQAEYRLSVIEI